MDGLTGSALVAVLLGLRHATDPDHVTAVATLVLSERDRSRSRAGVLGLAWGLGHGVTLFGLGLPVVLAVPFLPPGIQGIAEIAVGAAIALLSIRLLVRWKQGYFHVHPHEHAGMRHAHPHVHEDAEAHGDDAAHAHRHARGRTLGGSFAMGLLHGVAGSAAAGLIVIAASPGTTGRIMALAMLAAGTALSMAVVSTALGQVVARGPARRFEALVPAVGLAGLAFGVAYGLHAAGMAPGLAPFLG